MYSSTTRSLTGHSLPLLSQVLSIARRSVLTGILVFWGYTYILAQDGPVCSQFQHRTIADGLGAFNVNDVYAVDNMVYAATFFGLSISNNGGDSFTNYNTNNGLGGGVVNGVYAVGNTVYAATGPGIPFPGSGGIGGLSISTNGGNSFTNYTTANGLGSNVVNRVYVMDNTIYASTTNGLSISTNGGNSFTNYTTANGLGSNVTGRVCIVNNTIYVATTGGLSISTNGGSNFTNYTTANGLGRNEVNSVHVVNNTIYAATDSGLSISTNGGSSFTNYNRANGLGSDLVRSVYAVGNTVYAGTDDNNFDQGGGLSISTNGGSSFTNNTSTNNFNTIYPSIYATANKLYVATNYGLYFCTDNALPVEFISFTAQPTSTGNIGVDWQTAWERNADHFEIQRSLNTVEQFQNIANLPAKGNTDTRQTYHFTDISSTDGIYYYRLKQVDRDGSFQYSKIVSVTIAPGQPLLSIHTNPVTDGRLRLKLRYWQANDLLLTTSGGQPVTTTATFTADGLLILQPSRPLAAGVYVITARREDKQQSVRVVWNP